MTKFQTDMDQILSNFIPYNNPYIILSWKVPTDLSPSGFAIPQEIRSEVLWSGSDPKAESKPLLTASGQQTEPAKLLTVLGQNRVYAQIKCVKLAGEVSDDYVCLLYTSPSPRD